MRVTTAWAMSITGANRLKFNETVAAGHYQCAPETSERTVRFFDFADLIGLTVFARMMKLGISKRVAADMACRTVGYVRNNGQDLQRVILALADDGSVWGGPYYGEGKDNGRPYIDPNSPQAAASIQVNIPQIKKFIIERCQSLIKQHGDENGNIRAMFPEGWEKKL